MSIRAYVYWNLHKGGFSIKALEGPAKGKVVAYASEVLLGDVTFKVSESGRQRSITKHKEVHAGMQGDLIQFNGTVTPTGAEAKILGEVLSWDGGRAASSIMDRGKGDQRSEPITYNPHKYPTFVTRKDERSIHGARVVYGRTAPTGRADCIAKEVM